MKDTICRGCNVTIQVSDDAIIMEGVCYLCDDCFKKGKEPKTEDWRISVNVPEGWKERRNYDEVIQ